MRRESRVASEAMWKLEYDDKTQILTIYMNYNPPKSHGEKLEYSNVSRHIFHEFQVAGSKGAFFNAVIRPNYERI